MAADVLYVNLDALTTEYNKKIDSALGKLNDFGGKASEMGKKLSLAVSLPLAALGFTMVKSASDMAESINKIDVAFKGSSQSVKDFAKTSLDSFGISQNAALEYASLFGDMATSMGISTDVAAKMSTSLVGLTADLASFKNIGIDQANTALSGIFTGETESLKRLGIVMTEANLQQFAYSKGIKTQIKDMDQASKVNLRYAYIMSNTTNAQGDFVRTGGGAANQMRIFTEYVLTKDSEKVSRIRFKNTLPTTDVRYDAVTYEIKVGMTTVPNPIKQAIKLQVADMYERREDRTEVVRTASASLLRPYKKY